METPGDPSAAGVPQRLKRWFCWLLAPLVLLLPLFVLPRGLFLGNVDALFYGNILELTSDALHSGHLYTRWFADANASMGSPVMMFYAPLAYIATALVELPLGALHLDLGTRFVLGIYASQVLCAVTAFTWLKRHFSIRTALIGSLLYVLLPYKFIYIYAQINLAQLWALVFLPLWMLGAEKLGSEKLAAGDRARASAIFALAGAAAYYSHPLTVIAFGVVPVCYTLWFGRHRLVGILPWLAMACGLMAGLCLMLALPQRQYLSWIHVEGFLTGKFDWHGNLYHIDIVLFGYYGIVAALVVLAVKRCRAIRDSAMAGPSLFWAGIVAAVIIMNMPFSAFIWERVPILKYLQFPAARLHCAALMAVVFLSCVWLEHYKALMLISPRVYWPPTLAALIALFGLATGARIYQLYTTYIVSLPHVDAIHAAHIIPPPEYKTHWGCVDAGHSLDLYRNHVVPAPVEGAGVMVREWDPPRRIVFTADVKAAQAVVTVRQCYVPVWQAFDSGKPVPLAAIGPDGLIQMTLPEGQHTVEIRLAETRSATYSRWASAASLALCLLLLMVAQTLVCDRPAQAQPDAG